MGKVFASSRAGYTEEGLGEIAVVDVQKAISSHEINNANQIMNVLVERTVTGTQGFVNQLKSLYMVDCDKLESIVERTAEKYR